MTEEHKNRKYLHYSVKCDILLLILWIFGLIKVSLRQPNKIMSISEQAKVWTRSWSPPINKRAGLFWWNPLISSTSFIQACPDSWLKTQLCRSVCYSWARVREKSTICIVINGQYWQSNGGTESMMRGKNETLPVLLSCICQAWLQLSAVTLKEDGIPPFSLREATIRVRSSPISQLPLNHTMVCLLLSIDTVPTQTG